jgi:hypothetical protein
MPDKGKRRPPWTEQPVGGPRCETHSSANRRFQRIPRPSISTHRARSLASGQLGCARLPASLAAMPAGMRGALWFSWGLHWRCIMRFTYSSGRSSCLVLVWSRDDPRRPWRRSRTWPASGGHGGRLAANNVPAGLAATLTPSRTDRRRVDRSLMDYCTASLLEHSLPACQPASQALEHPSFPPKLAEFNSKARFPLGGGHNTHAALSPFSCSDNRESSLLSLPRDPVKLYLAMCNFVFGHEATVRPPVTAFPKRQLSRVQPFRCFPGPQNPLEISNGILPRRRARPPMTYRNLA